MLGLMRTPFKLSGGCVLVKLKGIRVLAVLVLLMFLVPMIKPLGDVSTPGRSGVSEMDDEQNHQTDSIGLGTRNSRLMYQDIEPNNNFNTASIISLSPTGSKVVFGNFSSPNDSADFYKILVDKFHPHLLRSYK